MEMCPGPLPRWEAAAGWRRGARTETAEVGRAVNVCKRGVDAVLEVEVEVEGEVVVEGAGEVEGEVEDEAGRGEAGGGDAGVEYIGGTRPGCRGMFSTTEELTRRTDKTNQTRVPQEVRTVFQRKVSAVDEAGADGVVGGHVRHGSARGDGKEGRRGNRCAAGQGKRAEAGHGRAPKCLFGADNIGAAGAAAATANGRCRRLEDAE